MYLLAFCWPLEDGSCVFGFGIQIRVIICAQAERYKYISFNVLWAGSYVYVCIYISFLLCPCSWALEDSSDLSPMDHVGH
jgi:hypothetical protein